MTHESILICAYNKKIAEDLVKKIGEPADPNIVWSDEQHAIHDWFRTPVNLDAPEHLVVEAFAGTGKSTTIVGGARLVPHASIDVKTLHAVGYAAVRMFRERIKCDFGSGRADTLTEKVCGVTAPDAIKKLVSKLHTKGREIAPHATTFGALSTIAIEFECLPDEQWTRCTRCGRERDEHDASHVYTGFDAEYVERKALDAMELASHVKSGETIDGSDMIFLPVRNGWLQKKYDRVIVDEAQDMTVAQLEIAQGVCRGAIAVVGDPNQAIYAFRGADSNSIARLKAELGARQLGLTTTRRCAKIIVARAQAFVPTFNAHASNPDGTIESLPASRLVTEAAASDFILSRVNAPLVSIAMSLLRSGKRTRIAGRDIGAGLKALVRKFKARSIPELLTKISAWDARETLRLDVLLKGAKNGRHATIQSKIDAIHDQADMLVSLTDGAKNVGEIEARIDALFTDDGLGDAGVITCSSVHKAKGLEAPRVFVLVETLRNHTQEELNIQYVAITRAKRTLVMVEKDNV